MEQANLTPSLFEYLRRIDDRQAALDSALRTHMVNEEAGMASIRCELKLLTSVTESMPHVDGKADFYGHRVDHDEHRATRNIVGTMKGKFFGKIGELIAIAAIVTLVMHGKELVGLILK